MSEESAVKIAQDYYNSDDADNFYFAIWGGEDIHVGLYKDNDEPIRPASERTVERMMACLPKLDADTRVLDMGAGYGGAARKLVRDTGCYVSCVNLSEVQNQRNREMNAEQGLADRIDVYDGSFDAVPYDDASFDVVWSEDSFLHAPDREAVLREAKRVLKPGGDLIFTDPMQHKDAPTDELQPVYDRIHLDSLASFEFYRDVLGKLGFDEVEVHDLSEYLPLHYGRVRAELLGRYDDIVQLASKAYVDRMLNGLEVWVKFGSKGYLTWGILHFRKRA